MKVSDLARESGYELAVNDVIRDHAESMKEVKKNLEGLRMVRPADQDKIFPAVFIAVFVMQGMFILAYLIMRMNRISGSITVMSRQIDDAMAGKKAASPTMKNSELKELHYKLNGLISFMEAEWGKKPEMNEKEKPSKKRARRQTR